MSRSGTRLNWQDAAICGVILLGTITITLTADERGNAYGEGSMVYQMMQSRASGIDSWDRYADYDIAYTQALRETSDSFDLRRFIVSGPDPLLKKEDAESAFTALSHVVKVTQDEDGAWSNLAWLYAIHGDTAKAIASEQVAIALYRYDYTYYVLLGAFLDRAGQINEAESAYGQALVLYPRLAQSVFWHDFKTNEPESANAAMQFAFRALDQEQAGVGDVNRNEVRARLAAETGRLDEANSIVRSINARLPNLSGMWELQGELHERERNIAEATRDYRRAIFLDKSDPLPRERLAELQLMAGDAKDARIEVLQAWELLQHSKSSGAIRRTIQYQRSSEPRNEQLPVTLLRTTQPSFDYRSAFDLLATLFTLQKAEAEANEMRQMMDRTRTHGTFYGNPGTTK